MKNKFNMMFGDFIQIKNAKLFKMQLSREQFSFNIWAKIGK